MRSSLSGIRLGLVLVLIGLVGLAGSPAAAGQGTATIVGQVTDQSGAALPGVTVTATSDLSVSFLQRCSRVLSANSPAGCSPKRACHG